MGKCPEVPSHPSPNFLPAPLQEPGGGPNLEVGLLEDAGQLGRGAALLRQLRQVPQDFLHQLQVVVPHCLQLRLLQPLMGLTVGVEQVRSDASPRAPGYQTVSCLLSRCPRGERPLVELSLEPGVFFRTMHGKTAPSC